VINGTTSADRYRDAELYTTCQWQRYTREGFVKPDNNGFEVSENGIEVVGGTVAARSYDTGNGTRYNEDERAVARDLVDTWMDTSYPRYPDRLMMPNATRVGVGVEVTQYGEVYATADLC